MNCPGCEATRWPGGQVPAARRVFRYVLSALSLLIDPFNAIIGKSSLAHLTLHVNKLMSNKLVFNLNTRVITFKGSDVIKRKRY